MAEEANKGLVALLVAAIIVSIAGTLVSLNKLNQLGALTGFATTQQGKVNFTVSSQVSITLTDNLVDFGTCDINNTATLYYESNETYSASPSCSGLTTAADYMVLENNGNVNVSVTLQSNKDEETFINAPSSTEDQFAFMAWNDEANSCGSGLPTKWVNITAAATPYTVCSNLDFEDPSDSIKIAFRIGLPPDTVPETKEATITFTASQA